MKFITTSWDDGHVLDFRLADLLQKYQLPATFYVPQSNPERAVMDVTQIKRLAEVFEIGGHTLSHARLDVRDKRFIKREVEGSYEWLSQLLGYVPSSFCFPMGKHNATSIQAVFECGYKVARTTELLKVKSISGSGLMPTTIQVFAHSGFTYTRHLLKRGRLRELPALLHLKSADLEVLVRYYLEKVPENRGCFHLWGHSWEIDQFNLWNKLEDLFKILSYMPTFCYTANKDLPLHGSPD